MLNKLLAGIRGEVQSGDTVICAVSGGADSMALLWGMYLLKDQLQVQLQAAHFNHGLRGEESDRDADFVKSFCQKYDIPLHMEKTHVVSGEKGLEAAARDARYGFFATLGGKLLTAHTANDNAETVLMHLIRGTGLKGLGGIAPVRGNVIRPMLNITRREVLDFLQEYSVSYVEDSTNAGSDFLRNRVRHDVMPLLLKENPRLARELSSMAFSLREDEAYLQSIAPTTDRVSELKELPESLQIRSLFKLMDKFGLNEASRDHLRLVRSLVYSDNPSARVCLPGGTVIERNYDQLRLAPGNGPMDAVFLNCPGVTQYGEVLIRCEYGTMDKPAYDQFVIKPHGNLVVRSRLAGDEMRLKGGRRSLKRIFIDRKIPASQRAAVPVLADDTGVVGVYGIGANLDRVVSEGVLIKFEKK